MHVFAHSLQPLFVIDAEVLLFVDDEKPEPREFDLLAKQSVGADDNINRAGLHAGLHLGKVFGRDHARGLRDLDRQPLEAFGECAEVLSCQQRCRHDDCDLHAVHGGNKRGAHCNFGFAKADVAANEPVHRAAGAQVFDNSVNAGGLIFGFFIRKARDEFVVRTGGRKNGWRLAQQPQGCNLDEFVGNLAQTLFEPGLARLPRNTPKPVELTVALVRSVAR